MFDSSFQTRMNFPAPLDLQDATGPCLVPDSLLQFLMPSLHTYSEIKKRGLCSSDPNPAYSWPLEGTGQFLRSPILSISHVGYDLVCDVFLSVALPAVPKVDKFPLSNLLFS